MRVGAQEMKTRLRNLWESLHSSYWFIPSLMTLGAVVVSSLVIHFDQQSQTGGFTFLPWGTEVSPEGARKIFATVAGSMITVAGVVFSITIVALSLATTQFGPRLLRSFMRDRANQFVLGTFIATFVYCLLLLRTTHGDNGSDSFVPQLGLAIGMLLTLLSLGVFIFFIHHAADSIQAPTVAALVGHEFDAALDKLYPERIGHDAPEKQVSQPSGNAGLVHAAKTGYLRAIDSDGLLELARREQLVLEILVRPGDFIISGGELARCWSDAGDINEIEEKISCRFFVGRHRTVEQDVQFPVQQLVDMALRALSQTNSDPHTAITCVNHLGAGLCKLAERTIPSGYRFDEEHELRIIAHPVTFACVADTAFRPLREHGAGETAFAEAMLNVLLPLAKRVQRSEDADAVKLHAKELFDEARQRISQPRDRERLANVYNRILAALDESERTSLSNPKQTVEL